MKFNVFQSLNIRNSDTMGLFLRYVIVFIQIKKGATFRSLLLFYFMYFDKEIFRFCLSLTNKFSLFSHVLCVIVCLKR
jgi:hypothetical protein